MLELTIISHDLGVLNSQVVFAFEFIMTSEFNQQRNIKLNGRAKFSSVTFKTLSGENHLKTSSFPICWPLVPSSLAVILQPLYFWAPLPESPSIRWDRRILDAISRPATSSEKLRNSQLCFVKVMTFLCSLQPKLEVKNSVLPFTVAVSTCVIIIVWLRHCFPYFYLSNFVS